MNSVKKILLLVCVASLIVGCGENTQLEEKKEEEIVNKYTVTWKDEDGTVLEVDNDVADNQLPNFNGELPTKAGDSQYSYSFKDWSPKVTTISQDTTYTATYTVATNEYNVIWKDEDGTILEIDKVPYGTMPTFNGSKPKKENTPEFSYEFVGFSPKISAVTEDVVYFASYKETKNTYSVTWKNSDGTVLEVDDKVPYGEIPTYDGVNPSKARDAHYSYNWTGWSPDVEPVSKDVTYIATFAASVNYYEVTWKNYDGTTLEVDTVPYGTLATYDGKDPKKESNVQYTYSWTGWDKEVLAVTSDVTYTATFSETINKYKVTWENYDGTVLETDDAVEYGTLPTYDGAEPVKLSNEQYNYKWTGWSPIVSEVAGDIKYTATFEEDLNTYTVTWKNSDGTVLEVDDKVPHGTLPTYDGTTPAKATDSKYTYEWAGWDAEVKEVTGDVTYTAVYNSTQYGYTVNFDLKGGSSTSYVESKIITEITSDVFFYDVTKENVNFRGWLLNNQLIFDEHGNKVIDVELVDNMTFVASYTNTVKLMLVSNVEDAGTLEGSGEYDYYTYANVNILTNHGYYFVGWYEFNPLSSEYDALISTESNYKILLTTKDTIVMAKFEKLSYELHIYSNNPELGLVDDSESSDHIPRDEVTVVHEFLSTVTVTAISLDKSCPFLGWYDSDNNLISDKQIYIFDMISDNFELEAKWDRFNITYDLDGGTNNPENPNVFSYKDEITLLNPTKEHYDFVGWKIGDLFVTEINGLWLKDVTITALWAATEYSITYILDNGTNNKDNPSSYNIESNDIVLNDATKEHYDFVEWTDSDGNQVTKIESGSVGDKILTANFEPIVYNIFYDVDSAHNNPNNPSTYTIESETITLLEPKRDFYAFDCWTDENNNKVTEISKGSFGDIYLYAHWVPIDFTITYNLNGGVNSENNPASYNIESGDVVFKNPTKDYYDFVSWTDADGNVVEEISAGSSGDVTLQANWSTINYKINYVLNDGINSDLNPTSYNFESSDIALEKPTKENDLFDGWYLESDYKTEVTTIPQGSHGNLTLYAKWCGLTELNYSLNGSDITLTGPKNEDTLESIYFEYPLNNYKIVAIKEWAFYYCASLTSVVIPKTVTAIGSEAFNDDYSLTIYCEADSRPSGWDQLWASIYTPFVWGCSSYICINGVNYGINKEGNLILASINDKSITEFKVPSTAGGKAVVGIGTKAFYNCKKLIAVLIPSSIIYVQENAAAHPNRATFYCEINSRPSGWNKRWSQYHCPVVWNCVEYVTIDGINYGVAEDGNLIFTCINDKSIVEYEIPSTAGGKQVIGIADYAFSDYFSLESVIIPNTIKFIGFYSFGGNDSLKSIIIPDSVEIIMASAFENDNFITIYCVVDSKPEGWDIEWNYRMFPVVWGYVDHFTKDGINYALTKDGNLVVASLADTSITDVVIPSNVDGKTVAGITDFAFSQKRSITSVFIPDTVTTIGCSAFENCVSLISINIPNSITTIKDSAFYGCKSLTSIVFPKLLEEPGLYIFGDCSSLTIYCEFDSKPDNWYNWNCSKPVVWGYVDHFTKDGINYALTKDGNLVVTSLADTSITDLVIPSNVDGKTVTGISEYAFSNNSSIKSVFIPSSILTIGKEAFFLLKDITFYCEVDSKPDTWSSNWNSENPFVWGCVDYFTKDGINYALTKDGNLVVASLADTSITDLVIPSNVDGKTVTSIADYAFFGMEGILSIIIPDSVTTIGNHSFALCTSLTSLYIPDSVTSIGYSAFRYCYALTSVHISNSLSVISMNSFTECTSLTTVYIPDSVTTICHSAFTYCSSLRFVYIPDSVTNVEGYVFQNCNNLTIYCEFDLKPNNWDSSWNYSNCTVVWGYTISE